MTDMSNSFTIQAGLPIHGAAETVVPPRNVAPDPMRSEVTRQAQPTALLANPSFRFDPTTGFVVIEFRDGKGTVSNTIPSQRQLAAYRTHQQSPPGEPTATPGDGKTSAG